MARINPDGRLHARTHIHQPKIVNAISRFIASGFDKNRC